MNWSDKEPLVYSCYYNSELLGYLEYPYMGREEYPTTVKADIIKHFELPKDYNSKEISWQYIENEPLDETKPLVKINESLKFKTTDKLCSVVLNGRQYFAGTKEECEKFIKDHESEQAAKDMGGFKLLNTAGIYVDESLIKEDESMPLRSIEVKDKENSRKGISWQVIYGEKDSLHKEFKNEEEAKKFAKENNGKLMPIRTTEVESLNEDLEDLEANATIVDYVEYKHSYCHALEPKLKKINYYANVLKKPVNYIKAMVKGIIKNSPEVRWTDKEQWFMDKLNEFWPDSYELYKFIKNSIKKAHDTWVYVDADGELIPELNKDMISLPVNESLTEEGDLDRLLDSDEFKTPVSEEEIDAARREVAKESLEEKCSKQKITEESDSEIAAIINSWEDTPEVHVEESCEGPECESKEGCDDCLKEEKEDESDDEEPEEIETEGPEFNEDDIDELDECSLNKHIDEYLKEVYSNVKSYETTGCELKEGKLIVEGKISFNSGKEKLTMFEFLPAYCEGNLFFEGYNKDFSEDKAFTLNCSINESKTLITESFGYKYKINENLVEGLK